MGQFMLGKRWFFQNTGRVSTYLTGFSEDSGDVPNKIQRCPQIELFPISTTSPPNSQSSNHRERLKILMVTKSGLINSSLEKKLYPLASHGETKEGTPSPNDIPPVNGTRHASLMALPLPFHQDTFSDPFKAAFS
ncbi:hypothetical protein CDAR_611221 [Caerostris darwini]|uniref:Uncharacterized protein n=1 Tax=Caerostris darwini TaxID=1538125 RepID=A0AAV4TCT5_9ARAC|nr:hypothetical protein CDAR_611221 [Caerostris darwini]